MPRLSFGLELANVEPWPLLSQAAQIMDQQRWRTLWTYDHLIPCTADELPLTVSSIEECENGPILEGWTLLAALGALTKRIRLGTMVTSVTMRHPALLAKEAITVDHISSGRVDLGLGVGWFEHEHQAFGIPLGTLHQRSDRLEEGACLLQKLLNGPKPVSHEGQFWHIDKAPFAPAPMQKHLPLLVAGSGAKRTLRTVARYADACNVYANMFASPQDAAHSFKVLEQHCEEAGRDPGEIRRTVTAYADIVDDPQEAFKRRRFLGQHLYDEEADALPFGPPQMLIDFFAQFIDMGVDEIVLNAPRPTPETLQRFDEEVLSAFD